MNYDRIIKELKSVEKSLEAITKTSLLLQKVLVVALIISLSIIILSIF